MKLIGFNFTKINSEKKESQTNLKDVKVKTNLNISNIEEINSNLLNTKEQVLRVNFIYNIDYSPDYASVNFSGNLILSLEPKKAKEVLKKWKEKKIDEELKVSVFNIILKKSNIKALQLEDEMNLPLHFPLPSVKKQQGDSKNNK